MIDFPELQLSRRRPRAYREWRKLRDWRKLPEWEAQRCGYILKSVRLDAGLTQRQLADRLQVTQQAISQAERWDANPTVDLLFAWARACERTLELRFKESPALAATEV